MTGVACPDNPMIQLLILTQNILKILLKTTNFGFFLGGVADQPMSGPFLGMNLHLLKETTLVDMTNGEFYGFLYIYQYFG